MELIIDSVIFENSTQGGIARVFTNVLPLLCNLDPNLSIKLLIRKTPLIPLPMHKQITHINLRKVYNLRPYRFWKPYFKRIQQLILKLLLCNTRHKVWFSTYFTRPPSKWKGKEVVLVHDFIYELYPDLMPASKAVIDLKSDAILAADKVFCNSITTSIDLKKFYDVADPKITVAFLGYDRVFRLRNSSQLTVLLPFPFILYVGKRSYYKGFDNLLLAYSRWNSNREFKLALVGSALSEAERENISSLGLSEQVVVFEKIEDDLLCELYNLARAFIYPSVYEGFGIPLLEAMACGCPVIASKIPSTVEVAGDVPIYFEPSNIESLLKALDLATTGEDLSTRVEMGLQKATNYSWEKTAKTIYEGLKELYESA